MGQAVILYISFKVAKYCTPRMSYIFKPNVSDSPSFSFSHFPVTAFSTSSYQHPISTVALYKAKERFSVYKVIKALPYHYLDYIYE